MDSLQTMREILSDIANNRVSNEGAEKRLQKAYSKAELAEFIVDAFQRDWITNFNIGLNEDGNII